VHLPYNRALISQARQFRKNPTRAEKKLWEFLQTLSVRFLRQRPIDNFIVDFYCSSHRLVIEVDGNYHSSEEQKGSDAERTQILESFNLRILRFSNQEILQNIAYVKAKILDFMGDPPNPLIKGEQNYSASSFVNNPGQLDNCADDEDIDYEAPFTNRLVESFTSQVDNFLSDKHYETPQIMRLIYTRETGLEISIEPYEEKNNSLRLRVCNKWLIESTSPLNSFKSFNYLSKYLSCKESQDLGLDDSLLVNEKGHLVETSKANLFFMKNNGRWITPSLSSGCLPGVIREALLNYFNATELEIHPESLSEFKSVIATNSLIEVQPISQIDNIHFETFELAEINKIKQYLHSMYFKENYGLVETQGKYQNIFN
jgi:very-short-patch-repair endonuclease/branched-subunit amino acid aminotransferase/4-amino-4-deoxychorismate lyase